MAELLKFNQIANVEVTLKSVTVGDIAKVVEADIGKLCTYNADGQVGIDATNTTELGIAGVVRAVSVHSTTINYVTVQIGGCAEVTCGETVAFSANRTFLGTYNGLLYVASAAVATSGQAVSLIEGGTTTKKAVIKLG